jgi:superfamily I DNA and/or RNA helicase
MIRSNEFTKLSPSRLTGSKVMLCTLSMLSSVFLSKFTRFVPLRTLVVDEASQIKIGDYIPAFLTFSLSLRKVCFIGDDKQRTFN